MAVYDNNPTFTYVRVKNLTIVHNNISYKIENIYTSHKYLYWDLSTPNTLIETNIRPTESKTKYLICINDKGIHTLVEHDDLILNFDTYISQDGVSKSEFATIKNQVNENEKKYTSIANTVDGISSIIGDEKIEGGSLIQNINVIKNSSTQVNQRLEKLETSTTNDKYKDIRDKTSDSLINLLASISSTKMDFEKFAKDGTIDDDQLNLMKRDLAKVNNMLEELNKDKDTLANLIKDDVDKTQYDALIKASDELNAAINSMVNLTDKAVSDKDISSNDVTTVIQAIGISTQKLNTMKVTFDQIMKLALGSTMYDHFAEWNMTAEGLQSTVGSIENTLKKDMLSSSKILYYLSTSRDVLEGGEWLDTIPTDQTNGFMWIKIINTYTSGKVVEGDPTCITPKTGLNGADGIDGKDGTSIIWQGSFASHPANPKDGWAYYNTKDKKSYVYQSGTWYQMTVDGTDGQDGHDGLSVKYKGELKDPPINPEINWCYKDTDNGTIYIWNGNAWEVMVLDGNDGTDGAKGDDGNSVYITYNDSATLPSTPTGDGTTNGWHTNATKVSVWMSQKVASSATDGTWGAPIKIKGEDGKDGTSVKILGNYNSYQELIKAHPTGNTNGDGYMINGDLYVWDGTDFKNVGKIQGEAGETPYIHIKYSNDGKTFTDNDGEDVGTWIGIYTDYNLRDSDVFDDYKWTKMQGEQGLQGVPGKDGKDGKTTYTWIKYADDENGNGISNSPTNKEYIGFAYNKDTAVESNNPNDYIWSLIKGEKGDTGVKGDTGEDGITYYTWIKYSDYPDGSGLYDTPKDTTKYIGIAVNKTTDVESNNKADYTWSLFKGNDGEKGQSLVNTTQQWYSSTSSTTQTGGSWVETMPKVEEGKYIWTRYKLLWENPTMTTYTNPVLEQIAESVKEVHIRESKLEQDMEGFKTTVKDTYVEKSTIPTYIPTVEDEYYLSDSQTQLINGTWGKTYTIVDGKYIWKRLKTTKNGNVTYSDPVCLTMDEDGGVTIILTNEVLIFKCDTDGKVI